MKNFGFPHSPEDERYLVQEHIKTRVAPEVPEQKKDEMAQLVFAPDPITGNPSSALGMYLGSNSEKVREVIRTHFFVDSGVGNDGVDDPDLAMSGVKDRYESCEQYINRLFDAANLVKNED